MRTFDKTLVSEGLAFALGLFDDEGLIGQKDCWDKLTAAGYDAREVCAEGIGTDGYFYNASQPWEPVQRFKLCDEFPTERRPVKPRIKW